MIEVVFKKRQWLVPETWDECTPRQFLGIVAAMAHADAVDRATAMLRAMLGMSWWRFKLIAPEQLMRMLHLVDWVGDDRTISRQLVPEINAGEKLYGPRDGFSNLTAGEFHFADMFYTAWKENGDVVDLYRFIAVLFRPGKKRYHAQRDPDGDRRRPFNPNLVEYYARKLAALHRRNAPATVAVGASFCYESWRMELEQRHQRIFSRKAKAAAAQYGWLPILRGIAKGGQYGTMDNVEQMYFGTLMVELELLKDEEAELKRKHPELFKD